MNCRRLISLILIAVGVLAYHNSFQGGFLFDDEPAIGGNPHVRNLWPIWETMSAPTISSVAGRPVVSLTLAINYALGGLHTTGYHVFNLSIHLLSALLLFGIVRRTLDIANVEGASARRSAAEPETGGRAEAPPTFAIQTPWLAMAVALVWLVHPLQTESVNYIVQRTELLMGFFLLLTLYCVVRGSTTAVNSRNWYAAAVGACALGMASKEVMVSAPLVVLLYDRVFLARSFREALRSRGGLYAALAATWILLALCVAVGQAQTRAQGFGRLYVSPWHYLLTQSDVIVHYLRLCFWPHPLVADYDWPLAKSLGSVLPQAIVVVAMLGGTLLAFRRHPWLGFLGAWFFLILAPTSSVLPIATEVAAERRMYLPLAAVITLVVLGAHHLARSAGATQRFLKAAVLSAAVLVLGLATVRRNQDYENQATLMRTVVEVRPNNARAHYNLAVHLQTKNPPVALAHYREALRVAPHYVDAHNNMGVLLASQGQLDEAIAHLSEAARLSPDVAEVRNSLGAALGSQGRTEEALAQFEAALLLKPDHPEAQRNREIALAARGLVGK